MPTDFDPAPYEAKGYRMLPVSPKLAHLPRHKITFGKYYPEGKGAQAFLPGQNLPDRGDEPPYPLRGPSIVVKVYFGPASLNLAPELVAQGLDFNATDTEAVEKYFDCGENYCYIIADVIDDGETLEYVPPSGPAPIGVVSLRGFTNETEIATAVAAIVDYIYGDDD